MASLATTPGTPPATAPPVDSGVVTTPDVGAGVVDSYAPPVDGGSLDLPPVDAALPDEDQGLTPVAPSVQAGQPLLPASAFVDPALPVEVRLRSAHGSLTPDEMLVPLVAAPGRR